MIDLDITYGHEICSDLDRARHIEWLETNGLGGFACSTICGVNARRYHGLLTAALHPPVGRVLLLSKLEEEVMVDGRRFALSVNQYPGAFHPNGHLHLVEFRLQPVPTFVYRVADFLIEKRVFMVHGHDTVVVEYEAHGAAGQSIELEVCPLLAFRDYHSTTHKNDALNWSVEESGQVLILRPYPDLPSLHLTHNANAWEKTGWWHDNVEYELERERGLDFREDLFSTTRLHFTLAVGGKAWLVFSTEPDAIHEPGELLQRELARRSAIRDSSPVQTPLGRALAFAADQFIVRRSSFHSIIAGYPWFSDWGRDTMISLPGLALATRRFDVAQGVLRAFAEAVDGGMLPNRFPDAGETPEYNTIDASLWFFESVRSYLHYTGDYDFVREHLYGSMREIMKAHLSGTRYSIHVDADGLLSGGAEGAQLTWMDAKIGDWVVTPRAGKPVEIQALWYNALCVLNDLCRRFGDLHSSVFLREMAALAKKSFGVIFWNEEAGCLYDVAGASGPDSSIRPNQLFAVSLHHPILEGERARQVVGVVERELLTPLGLRTLSPADPSFRPAYSGGVLERDGAYHQGTVWPWLIGPFVSAYIRVNAHSKQSLARASSILRGFESHLHEACAGQVSEIANGAAPHTPSGCFAQAWSVAELMRVAVEVLASGDPSLQEPREESAAAIVN